MRQNIYKPQHLICTWQLRAGARPPTGPLVGVRGCGEVWINRQDCGRRRQSAASSSFRLLGFARVAFVAGGSSSSSTGAGMVEERSGLGGNGLLVRVTERQQRPCGFDFLILLVGVFALARRRGCAALVAGRSISDFAYFESILHLKIDATSQPGARVWRLSVLSAVPVTLTRCW